MKIATLVFLLFLNSVSGFAIDSGATAPAFALPNQDGKIIRLSDFKGSPVLLFFYPKDDTPGCTKEACTFRDEYLKFKQRGAVVLGISRQDSKSHEAFKTKHRLPFDLLSDEDGSVAKAYGVGKMPIVGYFSRQSVLIGPDGKVIRFYSDVDPASHPAAVLRDLSVYLDHAKTSG